MVAGCSFFYRSDFRFEPPLPLGPFPESAGKPVTRCAALLAEPKGKAALCPKAVGACFSRRARHRLAFFLSGAHDRFQSVATRIRMPTIRTSINQIGDNIHHHDHVITPQSFKVINTMVSRPAKPIPPEELLDVLLMVVCLCFRLLSRASHRGPCRQGRRRGPGGSCRP